MRKVLAIMLAVLLLGGSVAFGAINNQVISKTTLTNVTTSATTGPVYIGDYRKVGFLVVYTEDIAGAFINTALVGQYNISSVPFTMSWFDLAGNYTMQGAENITANTTYFMWLDQDKWPVSYVNLTFTAGGVNLTAANNVTAYIIGQK
jgi:hypothetical protein